MLTPWGSARVSDGQRKQMSQYYIIIMIWGKILHVAEVTK
jgi:hypothetical protein